MNARSLLLRAVPIAALASLSACGAGGDDNGMRVAVFDEIAPEETLKFAGNEPFWGGSVTGTAMEFSTPDTPDGTRITVERFQGNGGLSYNGTLNGARFVMAVTPGECSDTMADRTYPYTITVMIDDLMLEGCGWTRRQPFVGDGAP